jgi:hypothetical protein
MVRVKKAERRWLHRSSQVQWRASQSFRDFGFDHLANGFSTGPVQDQPERAFGIVLTDQDDCTMEE